MAWPSRQSGPKLTFVWLVFVSALLFGADAGHAQQHVLSAQLDSLRAAQCHRHAPRDWLSFPSQCKTAVKTVQDGEQPPISSSNKTHESLLPFIFDPLPLGTIKPLGWLRDQLQLMADGLPGHEYDFYRLVRDNPWLGGSSEYSPLNEAFPYWFNGLVPLAYSIDEERLKKQVLDAAEYVVSHQQDDGWLGPEIDEKRRNFWGTYPVFLAFSQLVEAEPRTKGAVVPAMHRFLVLMHSMLSRGHQGFVWHPGDLFDEQWGRSRAADMIMSLQWLYEKYPRNNEQKIYECMGFLYEQAYDWSHWFSEDIYIREDLDTWPLELTNSLFPYVHGVNAGQGLKAGAVMRRLVKKDSLLNSTRNGVNWTFTYHGTPTGGIIGDERLAGLSPVRGVELCSVVETMFSLTYNYHALGEKDYADKAELAAFNALPVMIMPRWWAHQYIAQTNQPISHQLSQTPFWNVGPHGQRFGLEPNYPCCTVDFPQGYPKFLSASFARNGTHGLVHALLGPAEVDTRIGNGTRIHVSCKTNYPFDHVLYYTVDVEEDGLWFSFRVPGWAVLEQTTMAVDGRPSQPVLPDPVTGMHTVQLKAGRSIIVYEIGADIRVEPRANDTVSVYHGALLYAVSPFGVYDHRSPVGYPDGTAPAEAQDWTITPRSPWALAIDTSTLHYFAYPNRDDENLPNPIWEENAPPTLISALVCEIEWHTDGGYAANPPSRKERNCTGRAFMIGLKPYGSSKLHMAELPTVDLRHGSDALWQPT